MLSKIVYVWELLLDKIQTLQICMEFQFLKLFEHICPEVTAHS